MSQGFRDEFRNADFRTPLMTSPPASETPAHAPRFADLVDLVRHPTGILSEGEHHQVRDFVRAIIGLPPVELDAEDEDLGDLEDWEAL